MENLLKFNFNQRYLVLDTETEGLNLITSRPWQISWLVSTGKKVEAVHDHFVAWEDLKVSPDAARITGFDKKKYIEKREDPHHVFNLLWKEIAREDTIIVGHNLLQFDIYVINTLRRLLSLQSDYSYLYRLLDTNALAVAIRHNLQPPHALSDGNLLSWQYKLAHNRQRGVKTNMGAMLKHYDIPYDAGKLHNAEYDIRKNHELLWKELGDLDL